MNIIFILLITALFQILGSFMTWFFVKRLNRHHNLLLMSEIAIMLVISGEIIFITIKQSPEAFAGVLAGLGLVFLLNRYVPHKHVDKFERLGWLVFAAMCIHEFPEGIAFGSVYILNSKAGLLTAGLIALHNLPEGSIVTMPYFLNNKARHAFYLTMITQLLYVAGGLGSYFFLLKVGPDFQAFFASIAAGVMIYIAFEELKFLRR